MASHVITLPTPISEGTFSAGTWYKIPDTFPLYIYVYRWEGGTFAPGDTVKVYAPYDTGSAYKVEGLGANIIPPFSTSSSKMPILYWGATGAHTSALFKTIAYSSYSQIYYFTEGSGGVGGGNSKGFGISKGIFEATSPGIAYTWDSALWIQDKAGALIRCYSSMTVTTDGWRDPSLVSLPTSSAPGQVAWNPTPGATCPSYLAQYTTGGSGYDFVVGDQFTPFFPATSTISITIEPVILNRDPYGDDDGSGGLGDGGDGSRESWDDTIGTPDTPGLGIAQLGSMGIFTPSTTQLQSFFKYLWSDAFSVDGFKKILSDPMQAIISLHALPCSVEAGASAEVAFGNIATGVSMPRVSSEWVTVDCGSIPFKKYYGSFFDYSPYTRFQIFLPYIGYKDISPDDFVGGSCHVVYHVHVPSGALLCYLLSSAVDNSVLYQYSGSCLMQLPITSGTYNNFIGSLVTGIASGATALGNISSVAGKVASGALSAVASASSAVASLGSVLSSKPTVSRSGSISGASGWMARQVPYVIRTRPNAVLTENLSSFEGYPLYRSRMLSQMSGYTVIEDIHLSGLSATSDEAEEIERLLKEGVIF